MNLHGLNDLVVLIGRFNWLDFVFFFIILYSVVTSYTRGVIIQVIGFVGLVAAIVGAGQFTALGANALKAIGYGSGPGLRSTTAFVAIFFIILIASRALAIVLNRLARMLMFGWLDHIGGAVFGLLESTVLILTIVYVILHFRLHGLEPAVHQSVIAGAFGNTFMGAILALLPQGIMQRMPPLI